MVLTAARPHVLNPTYRHRWGDWDSPDFSDCSQVEITGAGFGDDGMISIVAELLNTHLHDPDGTARHVTSHAQCLVSACAHQMAWLPIYQSQRVHHPFATAPTVM
jgi:hypothetical protein